VQAKEAVCLRGTESLRNEDHGGSSRTLALDARLAS
jgi:hypothetical protein